VFIFLRGIFLKLHQKICFTPKANEMNKDHLKKIANTIRGLSMDGVQKANSGHPGLPMGMADVAAVLFNEVLRFNPANPSWYNRDRFVLSGGHGSMLLYSLLHLYGYKVSMDDLKQFRQWGSITPGHPEYRETPGVETTTGPLGQGLANAVGMALGEALMAAKYKDATGSVIDHFTYAMAGDGDLEEGLSHEVCSIAGHNKLSKLIVLYDSNDITIDGDTRLSYSEDTRKRFEAYGWDVQKINGHDYDEIKTAIDKAKTTPTPSIIICRTIIGFGSPNKAGSEESHGAPLGEEEVLLAKKQLGIPADKFYVSSEVYEVTAGKLPQGEELEKAWQNRFDDYISANPEEGKELLSRLEGKLPEIKLPEFEPGGSLASRTASGKVLEKIVGSIPALIGGSADLSPSNKTMVKSHRPCSAGNMDCNYIHYGIREFGMGAIMNGLALYGGFIPYGGTFFVFSDYMRSAIRMSALMRLKVIFVFTHDSIGLGEDGPTHQPVEHLASLRAIPDLITFRPADANETALGWEIALNHNGPTALVLSRQNLKTLDVAAPKSQSLGTAASGGYIVVEDDSYDIILMATGSEVGLALEAKKLLNDKKIRVRVVSMPSQEIFEKQDEAYKNSVLPPESRARLAIEAGSKRSWYKYVGLDGDVVGMDGFGASAPADKLFEEFGFTPENIASRAAALLSR
jgi:transketolase